MQKAHFSETDRPDIEDYSFLYIPRWWIVFLFLSNLIDSSISEYPALLTSEQNKMASSFG